MIVQISAVEYFFHYLLFFVAVITPVIMVWSYSRFPKGEMRAVIGFFTLSYVFSALRWAGGSLARLRLPMADSLLFNFLWLLSGILAAVFGLYAANLLFAYVSSGKSRRSSRAK